MINDIKIYSSTRALKGSIIKLDDGNIYEVMSCINMEFFNIDNGFIIYLRRAM